MKNKEVKEKDRAEDSSKETKEEEKQIIFPATDILKKEILDIRHAALLSITKYRYYNRKAKDHVFIPMHGIDTEGSQIREGRLFVSQVIRLYQLLRPSILYSKKLNKKFKVLIKIDEKIEDGEYSKETMETDIKLWSKWFNLIDELLYLQGLTKLALDKELLGEGITRR